jgi:SAM-dependent methyltransferase
MKPLIAEFLGISELAVWEGIERELQNPGSTVANAWKSINPRNVGEINRFYAETSSYIYDLVVDHCHKRRRAPAEVVRRRIERKGTRRKVLMYGDGIGTDSIALARRGHRVTYFDVPGMTSMFARFRFERERLTEQICVLDKEEDIEVGSFDAAICIEVLEHVPDPPSVMRCLYRALKPGGIALISESFESVGDEFPSHLPENFQYAGRTHQLMEGLGFASTYYNNEPLNRPMEFTKLDGGVAGALTKFNGKLRRAIDSRWRRIAS